MSENSSQQQQQVTDAGHLALIKDAIKREDLMDVAALLDAQPELLTPGLWPVAIFQAKSLAITELLLTRGLNPNLCSAPRKPLHFAADRKHPDIMAALLKHGADPDVRDGEGFMPLDLFGGLVPGQRDDADRANIQLLLDAGAKPNLWTWTRLGETARAMELLEADPGLIHAKSPDLGFLPLHTAARQADVALVQYLIRCGADVDAGENTPLWFACQSGTDADLRLEVIHVLLDAGADVHRICEEGSTALHYAAWRGPATAVELLLERGAVSGVEDKDGNLPADYVRTSQVLSEEAKAEILAALSLG